MSWPGGDPRRELRVARLRQAAAAGAAQVSGIVSAEVVETSSQISVVCELVFAPPAGPVPVWTTDVQITGGVRRPRIPALETSIVSSRLVIRVPERGDFSVYELSLRRNGKVLNGFDPLLSDIPLGFRTACQQGFDCEADASLDATPAASAPIDYLARDYTGFRRLMVDRFAQLVPGWKDAGAASPEITLIEMLASAADRVAYSQDAVATEAYLDTARLRVSAKRHARLLDYRMGEGSNARAFVHVRLREPPGGNAPLLATLSIGSRFMTRAHGVAPAGDDTPEIDTARAEGAQVFEAFEPARLSSRHNRIVIHDWLEGEGAKLARGSTELAAVDIGRLITLKAGDLLLLEEVLDADGNASPDPALRHVLRLTAVTPAIDPVGALDSMGQPQPLEILTLAWSGADALPFDLPLGRVASTDTVDGIPPSPAQPTAVARGNMVAVDHGEWREGVELWARRRPGRRRYDITLPFGPLTHTATAPLIPPSAHETLSPAARPFAQLAVTGNAGGGSNSIWEVSDEIFDTAGQRLALDIDDAGGASLRTGAIGEDDAFDASVPFMVRYRLGNGTVGNVGAEAIAHLLTAPHYDRTGALIAGLTARPGDVELVRNPSPAKGGVTPETIAEVRLRAPIAFRAQDRAVTGEDYVRFLLQHDQVSNARAVEQWTGAGKAIVLLVDLTGGIALTADLEKAFRTHLEPFRLAGHVLEFRDPVLIPVELAMTVCVRGDVPRDKVLERLMALFSAGTLDDGTPALFHPDRFGFGSSLRLSQLYAAAQGIDGVVHVEITALQRQGVGGSAALDSGTLDFGVYEIPILANDPSFPDRGVVRFTMEGGA